MEFLMTMKLTRTAKAEGPLTLSDLRKIVEQSADAPGDTSVTVKEGKSYSPVDFDRSTISVTWEVEQ
jgi:hypothetical protein